MTFELDPRLDADTLPVIDWALSTVRLMNDSRYPWLILVPRRPGMRDIIDLSPSDRHQLNEEIDHATRALQSLTVADKMNVASLGNMVQQLHIHVIARFENDDAWPKPVWGVHPATPYDGDGLAGYLERLRDALGASV